MTRIPFAEKAAAIRRVFPHIPQREVGRIAALLVTDQSLFDVLPIVRAYLRHTRTAYDRLLTGQMYGGSRTDARHAVNPQVEQIILSWR